MNIRHLNTLVIGSGASGLAAALRLKSLGVDDILLLSEGLKRGTSINTGSDKQTYYKLGVYGSEPDSPQLLAKRCSKAAASTATWRWSRRRSRCAVS